MKARRTWLVLAVSVALGLSTVAGTAGGAGAAEPSGKTLTIGYSAWPGWFPLAVAEKAGIFDDVGLKVKLRYFADYIGSLDAMSAGRLDANTQTLNDTMAGVASGSKQSIVVVNDNSAGNDAIICDKSVGNTIQDLKGKTIAAEEGVVDHFLLLQGLASVGLTQDDVDFRGVLTDAAAGAFAGGQFDCVGVFAPFTLQALERPGSHVVFSSKDFPGTIPDHIVVAERAREGPPDRRPEAGRRLVQDARLHRGPPAGEHRHHGGEGRAARRPTTRSSPKERRSSPSTRRSRRSRTATTSTSLQYTARQINPFLVESGLTQEEGFTQGPLRPQVHAGLRGFGSGSVAWRRARQLEPEVGRRSRIPQRPTTGRARSRAVAARARWRGRKPREGTRAPPRARCCGSAPRSRSRRAWCSRSSGSPACSRCGGSRRRSGRPTPSSSRARPRPGTRASTTGTAASSAPTSAASATRVLKALLDQHGHRHRARPRDRELPIGRVVLGVADRVPALHPRHRAHAAVPALARHRRAPEDRADHRRHRLLQHPDDRRRRARRAARVDRHLVHARRGTHSACSAASSSRTRGPASSTSPASTSRPRG